MARFSSYLLNFVYLAFLIVVSPFILWSMIRKGKYREGYGAKLLGLVPKRVGEQPCVWFHAVSVGEVNVLRTLIGKVVERWPDVKIAVSTTTKAGYGLAKKRFADHAVFYCPLDFSWAVRTAMRRIRPDLLVLAELELWPNLVCAAKESDAAVAIVNGRLSDQSFRGYRRIRPFVARVMRQIDVIASQDEMTANRFSGLGAQPGSVHVTGSLKYDGAETDRDNNKTQNLCSLVGIADDDIIFLAGSTQAPEEAIVLETFQKFSGDYPRLKLVLVPRHPERFDEVASLLDECGATWRRRSEIEDLQSRERTGWRVLLVDTVGELGAWWGAAQIGFVGGSLGSRGGQNMIEPAAYGVATSFGPNTRNFRDIVAALLNSDAAVVAQDGDELTAFVRRCLSDSEWAKTLGGRARDFVAGQLGATERTLELLERLMQNVDVFRRVEVTPGRCHPRGLLSRSLT